MNSRFLTWTLNNFVIMKNNINYRIMKTTRYILGFTAFFILFYHQLSGQIKPYAENVTVIAPYQPTISDANKLNTQPVFTDTVITMPKLEYPMLFRKYKTQFAAEPIKAARVGEPSLTKLYKFLLKAGFGSYTSPYGEFFVNNTYSRSYAVGGHLKHHSYFGKIQGWAYPGNNENLAEFYGKKFFKNTVIGGDISYKRNVWHYYGFKPGELSVQPLDRDLYKQRFNLITAGVYFNSMHHPDSLKLNYSTALKYYYLNDFYSVSENGLEFSGDIHKDLHLFKFTSSQLLGMQAKINYYFNEDSLRQYNAGIISLTPYIRTTFKGFNFNLGVDISVSADSLASFHFYPIADVQFNIVKNILIVFAGIKGNLEENTYLSFTNENPYINPQIPLSYTSHVYNIFGGIKSEISRTLNFSAAVSYERIKNMPMYVNDTSLVFNNRFVIIYDNAKLLNVKGELAYQKDEKFKLLVGGNFYNYIMDNEDRAWHKPIFDAYADFCYNIRDKFIIQAGITGRSNVYAKTFAGRNPVKKKLSGYADLNLGFEYRYSKILSAWINFNNVTNMSKKIRYYQWNNYPLYGFNLMAGISYAF
ncbi:MAG: hypothetical protein PHR81_06680 [Bacteroidales bacterium]|nr:hypothetical protein [Bacteroidales bacterium]